jgi:hypothetical protein
MAPCAASCPKGEPATLMAASSIGASEKTVKKEMDAPKLMAAVVPPAEGRDPDQTLKLEERAHEHSPSARPNACLQRLE